MINNRQGGRRRGRGGQRQGGGGLPGNRQDQRQRGNAAQLLEKYKSMARDSQLAGDRVQSEYYLQFADHYFRVLSENQRRFDDQRRQRGEDLDDYDEGDSDSEVMDSADASEADGDGEERNERQSRRERPRRNEGEDRPRRRAEPQAVREEEDDAYERPARSAPGNGSGDTLSLNVLPPAIGRGEDEADKQAPAKPRRRSRAARSADDEDVAPAA